MKIKTLLFIGITVVFAACKDEPKIIESSNETESSNSSSGIFSGESPNASNTVQNATISSDSILKVFMCLFL